MDDERHWQSVMVVGAARRLDRADEIEHAMQSITRRNPELTPALNQPGAAGATGRSVELYRIAPTAMDGRKTAA